MMQPAALSVALHVAGVGASAGGLEAMLSMFARMRPTGRISYVVAQHMAHNGHSELVARLIQRESALPVVLAVNGAQLKADTVYVIPSGKDGCVRGDTLTLNTPAPEHLSTPSINTLFRSIAETRSNNAIGILLSGTGSDGTAGCRAIKAAGGLTLAQEPAEAKFSGMPGSAIDANVIDRVLSVEQMGDTLSMMFPGVPTTVAIPDAMSAKPATATAEYPADSLSEAERRELQLLLRQVHDATGIDFSSYKEETLLRRLEKRKSTVGAATAEAYQALIRREKAELHTLQHLFLVSVSSFFRDGASFRELERALASLLGTKLEGEPIRVWVPGCASGEEPYTLAIILHELLGEYCRQHPVIITATDLNPEALAMAREGIYRQSAFKEMDRKIRDRYFTPKGQDFEVKPELKSSIRLEQRDVLSGAPAGDQACELDLVSCRNLLIYMKSHLQDRLIKIFYHALRPQGLLFIGQSESLTFVGNSLFTPVDNYHRLFRRRN